MKGKVYLVGAGPGNEGLITVRGLELIRKAEVLVYDRLVGTNIVTEASDDCEMIYVGKNSSNHTMNQSEINKVLIKKSKENKIVVRLKGGDPYVFGRGGEEAIELYDENIEFEIVPGITSPIGGLAYAGIPITHRDYASSFHIITGHIKEDNSEHDWDALARLSGTLVFLMGMSNLDKITKKLMSNNKSKETPVAIVHWASHPNQQVVEGTLETIVEEVKKSTVTSPSLIVVGEVVKLRKKLNFFEKKPLHGKRILVTRSTTQRSKMISKIQELGGEAISIPMIKINSLKPEEDINRILNNLDEYNYLIFTSVNGIKRFFEELYLKKMDSRSLNKMTIVCIGKITNDLLLNYGIQSDILPKRFVAEGLLEILLPIIKKEDKILIPRAKGARALLVDELKKICRVDELKLYESVQSEVFETISIKDFDILTFTSASTVRSFVNNFKNNLEDIEDKKIVSIGPITSDEIEKCGFKVFAEAKEHTIDGMIKTILSLGDI